MCLYLLLFNISSFKVLYATVTVQFSHRGLNKDPTRSIKIPRWRKQTAECTNTTIPRGVQRSTMEKRGQWVFALESNRSISTLTIGSITAPPQTDATSILSVEDFLWRGLVQDSCDLKHAWLWETETVSTGQRTTSSLLVYVGNHCHTVCLSEHVLEPQQLPAVPSNCSPHPFYWWSMAKSPPPCQGHIYGHLLVKRCNSPGSLHWRRANMQDDVTVSLL